MKKIGAIILTIGLLTVIFASFSFITREKVVDLGNLEISQKRNHSFEWSPAIGVVMIVIGGCVYLVGNRGK